MDHYRFERFNPFSAKRFCNVRQHRFIDQEPIATIWKVIAPPLDQLYLLLNASSRRESSKEDTAGLQYPPHLSHHRRPVSFVPRKMEYGAANDQVKTVIRK